MRTSTVGAFLLTLSMTAAAQQPAITAPLRIDPGTADGRWAAEYTAIAHGQYLAAMWMKEPAQQEIGGRRLFSTDYGTTFAIEDWELPNNEVDPMSALAVDGDGIHFWLGAKRGQAMLFLSRRDSDASTWGDTVYAYQPGNSVDKCWMAAGPTPGNGDTRVYIASGLPNNLDILWSDDLGATWALPIDVGSGFSWQPRVGLAGEFYLGHIVGLTLRIKRSIALNADLSPKFITTDTTAITATAHVDGEDFPGTFRAPTLGCIAVHPQDGKRVYAVLTDRTSTDGQGNVNVDVYFTKTSDATATNANGDDLVQWDDPKIIPAGLEVPGDQWFPWLEVTQTGTTTRLHLLYFSTQQNPNQQDSTTDPDCLLDVYYAYSDDEGVSWHENRLTPTSFNSADCAGPGGSFLGDYLGMAVAGNRVYAFYPMPAGSPLESEPHLSGIVFGEVPTYIDFTVVEGTLQSADDLALLTSSDNQRLIVKDFVAPFGQPLRTIVDVELDTALTSANASDHIDIRMEGYAIEANTTGRIYLRAQPAGEWILWKEFAVPTATDSNHYVRGVPAIFNDGGNIRDFVDANGRIDVRLEMTRPLDQTIGLTSHYDFVQVVVVDN